MDIGCIPEGKFHCTDNDYIEVSYINRQFNVGHSKFQTPCLISKWNNIDMKVKDCTTRAASDNEADFNEDF